jgi:hypothetical protein
MPVNHAKKEIPMAKKKAAQTTNLNDFYNEVSRRADTEGLQINAAETKRVLACFFDVLQDYPPPIAMDLIAKGLKRAAARR